MRSAETLFGGLLSAMLYLMKATFVVFALCLSMTTLAETLKCDVTRNDELVFSETQVLPADMLTPSIDGIIMYRVIASVEGEIYGSYMTDIESYEETQMGALKIITWDIWGAEDDTYVLDCKILP